MRELRPSDCVGATLAAVVAREASRRLGRRQSVGEEVENLVAGRGGRLTGFVEANSYDTRAVETACV